MDSPQSWNRFSYVNNNPIRFNDPTGHKLEEDLYQTFDGTCGAGDPSCNWVGNTANHSPTTQRPQRPSPQNFTNSDPSQTSSSGGLTLEVGLGGVSGIYQTVAAGLLNYKTVDNNIHIYGSRPLRSVAGLNPYTNRIGSGNLSRLFSVRGGFQSGYTSSLTWAGVAINALSNINNYSNGTYDGSDLAAAMIVDSVTTVGFAAIAGAVAGAVGGAVAGAVGGTVVVPGIGTVSGAVVGAIAGGLAGLAAGVGLSYGFNSYEVSAGQTLRTAAISSISSGIDSLFSP